MAILEVLLKMIVANWYFVIPELAYVFFAGFCFFGPGGALGVLLYLALFIVNSRVTMIVTGVIMAVHFIVFAVKGFIGDRIADSKRPEEGQEYLGVPKLSGDSKDIQDALDSHKK